ncbi:MAG: hypothetical protein WCQ47_04455 [bacterium]
MKNFSKNTLIIGAGAHVPYGFPTGDNLRDDIISLKDDSPFNRNNVVFIPDDLKKRIYSLFYGHGRSSDTMYNKDEEGKRNLIETVIRTFCDEFRRSTRPTIDDFLTRNARKETKIRGLSYQLLGKIIIAYVINVYSNYIDENESKIDWIEQLFDTYLKETKDIEAFFNNAPKIITFNYDTYLERKIYDFLVHSHSFNELNALEYIKKLSILHVYGRINYLYEKRSLDDELEEAIMNLNVVGEERQNKDGLLNEITKIINGSENIHFLGFGFAKENVDILFNKIGTDIAPACYSTYVGITQKDTVEINQLTPPNISVNFSYGGKQIKTRSCVDLLKEIPLADGTKVPPTTWEPDYSFYEEHL